MRIRERDLYNGFKFSCISERVLDDHLANILLAASVLGALGGGEEDMAVTDGPAPMTGEVDDGTLGVEEEEGLGTT